MNPAAAESLSSEILLKAYLAGDSRAFGHLWQRHVGQLRSVAYRYESGSGEASDFLQEAVLRILRSAAQFRGQASVSTWLTRIVINTSTDFLRGRFGRCPDNDSHTSIDAVEPLLAEPPRDWDLVLTLKDALASLPSAQSEALVAVDVWGFRTSEIADLAGTAAGTIKSRRARARETLVSQLQGVSGNRFGQLGVTPGANG